MEREGMIRSKVVFKEGDGVVRSRIGCREMGVKKAHGCLDTPSEANL